MRGTSLSMRFTLATAGMVLLSLFLANLVFEYAGKGKTDREFSLFAYQRATWLASELESRMPADAVDKQTRAFLSRSARAMDLSIVLLHEADEPLITAHGPSLATMLRSLRDHPDLGRLTDRGETPWEPAFDGSTDRRRYPDRAGRIMRVQEVWPYAVEAPVKSNMTLRIVGLSHARLGEGAFGRGLVAVGMILLLASSLVGGRVAKPLEALASEAASVARGANASPIGHQPFDEAQKIASAVNNMADRARRAEADRKALIGTVAGSFAGPIHRLAEHGESIDLTAVPPPVRPAIEALRRDAADLQDVVDDMKHWADLEAGLVALEPQDVDLRHMLEEVCAGVDCEVSIDVDDGVDDVVQADRAWLRVLLWHLVENAAEHGRGPLEITSSRAHTKVDINVRDHGSGVEDVADLRRMFRAFERLEDREGEALGVGLAIAQHVVALHRGGLNARNHPQGGLELRLWLPAPPIRVTPPDHSIDIEVWERDDDAPAAEAPDDALLPAAPAGDDAPEDPEDDGVADDEAPDDEAPDDGEDPYAPF